MNRLALVLILCSPLLQGCGLGVMAAGVGAAKAGSAQIRKAYTEYVLGMENINFEREKAKLQPRPILIFDEWYNSYGGQEKEEIEDDEL